MTYYPEVVQVLALPDKKIAVERIFRGCLTVMNDTAAWDLSGKRDPESCVDIDPFVLYEAENIEDPLAEKYA